MRLTRVVALIVFLSASFCTIVAGPVGYYRQPALHGETLVFVAEGDLWKVPARGGVAARLTTHARGESEPAISPDGKTIAFTARYEGPRELYTMPLEGGLPTRRTYGLDSVAVSGWTSDGRILYSTDAFSTLPNWQLFTLDVSRDDVAGISEPVPLAQAADGCYDDEGRTLFFTRLRFQGSRTKRYRGGTAQNIWKFTTGEAEASPLTADYPGTSKRPMCWKGRVYFASDRDGTMNLWSMLPGGSDLRQHTHHAGWEIASPHLDDGHIVYQYGADIRLYDIGDDADRSIRITLPSDLDQTRENWVEKPMEYVTSAHLSPDGGHVVITARGRVFVAPHRQGRLVEATRAEGVRYRSARFMPDGERLFALSDESGEVELWTLPANGVGPAEQLTDQGSVLRWEGIPSPDGKWIAHHDKDQRLYLYDVEQKSDRRIDENPIGGFGDLAWSPDSRWLAYVTPAGNAFSRIWLYGMESNEKTPVTSDRFDSYSPAWSPDGEWLYLLSDRNLVSIVGSPWGNYQPEPYLDKTTRIYQLALRDGLRSPFAPRDELFEEDEDDEKPEENGPSGKKKEKKKNGKEGDEEALTVVIDLEGIEGRLVATPAPPGNYSRLAVTESALFWLSRGTGERQRSLAGAKITHEDFEVKTLLEDVRFFELSGDGKKLLLRKKDELYIVDAAPEPAELEKKAVDLSAWSLSVVPREEWQQMFVEAWRLERDYFYDTGMHGVDWLAMLHKYLLLVDRVTTRVELSDLIGQMVSELSALHTFVHGGDVRQGEDDVDPASLGARLSRDESAGGFRVEHIYRSDPDEVDRESPLSRPGVGITEGDVIETVNGTPTLSVPDIGMLLRGRAGRQVLLRVKPVDGEPSRDAIVKPVSLRQAGDLRYHEWEYTRRLRVEEQGAGDIGYLHLRAMGGENFTEWAKGYYPVFNRKGLIIDVRHNRGGNIDSWIIGRLLRKVWFHWSQHRGAAPMWNMQQAFQGHVVVLCNERTASDGEAFAEGVKHLDLGTVMGTRTWGGEIWLSSNNFLVDRGIATAAEFGVYGPRGDWLIEGHGVEPNIVVDNPPHATFGGQDAQLDAAIAFLQRKIEEEPIPDWPVPEHPDKSFDY